MESLAIRTKAGATPTLLRFHVMTLYMTSKKRAPVDIPKDQKIISSLAHSLTLTLDDSSRNPISCYQRGHRSGVASGQSAEILDNYSVQANTALDSTKMENGHDVLSTASPT